MQNKMSALRLGIFVFLGAALIILAIFLVGEKRALFGSTFTVKAYFSDIQGLRKGSNVRLSGIDVGSVSDIKIVGDVTGQVEVSMNLITDIKRFIRTDTRASIETEGLVGNKVVVLQIGSELAPQVGDGGVILSKESIGFAQIIEETQGIMGYTKDMTKELSEIIARINRGEGTIGKILTDEELYNEATKLTRRADESLVNITNELNQVTALFNKLGGGVEQVVSNVNKVVADIDTIVNNLAQGKGPVGSLLKEGTPADSLITATLVNIQQTTEETRLGASRLAENMEALKHNWLFKSYFERRGYWDKSEYETELDAKLKELNVKIGELDKRIEKLNRLKEN